MASSTENTRTYWMMFLVSLVATIAFLLILPEWFWVALPFLCTAFVKANNWI